MILEERLTELETRLAFQESTIDALNDAMTKQQFQIADLEKNMKTLKTQLKTLAQPLVASEHEEPPPPHY